MEDKELKLEEVAEAEEVKEEAPVQEQPKKKKSATVVYGEIKDCKGLNLRAEPSLSSPVLDVLRPGDKFVVLKKTSTEEFYNVTFEALPGKSVSGFALKKYIELCSGK